MRALPEATVEALDVYPWPGNVRELRNVVEQAVLLERSERLEPELLNRLLTERPQRVGAAAPAPAPSTISRFIGRDDPTPPSPFALPIPTPVVPIAVGTKVEEAERQLALRTLEAYAGRSRRRLRGARRRLGAARRAARRRQPVAACVPHN